MRNTRVLLYTKNLRHNLKIIKAISPGKKICLAVKADAYGHGALYAARIAIEEGLDYLAVAALQEALELRKQFLSIPIVLYGLTPPDFVQEAIKNNLEMFCASEEEAEIAASVAKKLDKTALVHLKIDTGMGRIGVQAEEAVNLAEKISKLSPYLQLKGTCTHFPVAEDPDHQYTQNQLDRFLVLVEQIRKRGINPGLVHASNSAGLSLFSQKGLDMVRPGIISYGYPPGDLGFEKIDLKPVMEMRAPLSFIKECAPDTPISYGHRYKTLGYRWIGTVAAGYADGLPRQASGKLFFSPSQNETKKRGPWPQVGTICMDQCMVDLGPSRDTEGKTLPCPAKRWEEITIFGPKPAAQDAEAMAKAAGTISYEICCGIPSRLGREEV